MEQPLEARPSDRIKLASAVMLIGIISILRGGVRRYAHNTITEIFYRISPVEEEKLKKNQIHKIFLLGPAAVFLFFFCNFVLPIGFHIQKHLNMFLDLGIKGGAALTF